MNKDQEQQLEDEVDFANLGHQVLTNKAYQTFLTARKAQVFQEFCQTKADESEIRDEAWRTMKNLEAMEKYFKKALQTGTLAQKTLELHNKDPR